MNSKAMNRLAFAAVAAERGSPACSRNMAGKRSIALADYFHPSSHRKQLKV